MSGLIEIGFKAKMVSELLGRKGVGLTAANIRELAKKDAQEKSGYHLTYSPMEIRNIRMGLDTEFAERAKLKEMPPVVLFRMSKGGVGKTSISGNVALAIASQGYRVLLIDGDSQGSLSELMGVDTEDEDLKTIYHLLLEGAKIHDVARRIYADTHLDLIPADQLLSSFDSQVLTRNGRENFFKKFLMQSRDYLSANYDIIIIDSAPGTNILSFNFMVACNLLCCPVKLDGLSQKALKRLHSEVEEVEDFLELKRFTLPVRIVANAWHPTYKHCATNLEELERKFGNGLMPNRIPDYVGFSRQLNPEGSSLLFAAESTHVTAKAILETSRELLRITGIEERV